MSGAHTTAFVGDGDFLDHPGMTAPLDLRLPVITFEVDRRRSKLEFGSTLDLANIDLPRSPKVRDWEQRSKKRRRA